jgi:ATP-dependent Zn protease
MPDMMNAMLWVKFGESDGQLEFPRNRWAVAVHEAGHAVAIHHLMRDRVSIWFATVEKHGRTGGMVTPSPHDDDWLDYRSDLLKRIQVSLASRVAEELLLGEKTNGHGGDGPAATLMAERMLFLGHSKRLASLPFYKRDLDTYQVEVEAVLKEGLTACQELLGPRACQVAAVAHLLRNEGTVEGMKIHALLDEMEGR